MRESSNRELSHKSASHIVREAEEKTIFDLSEAYDPRENAECFEGLEVTQMDVENAIGNLSSSNSRRSAATVLSIMSHSALRRAPLKVLQGPNTTVTPAAYSHTIDTTGVREGKRESVPFNPPLDTHDSPSSKAEDKLLAWEGSGADSENCLNSRLEEQMFAWSARKQCASADTMKSNNMISARASLSGLGKRSWFKVGKAAARFRRCKTLPKRFTFSNLE